MDVAFSIPASLDERLQDRWGDLSRRAREAVLADAYREGIVTLGEVRELLGHATRMETEEFLGQRGIFLEYTDEEVEADVRAARQARS